MLMQMIDYLIEQDPSLSARRTIDMRRYIVNRWNRTHEDLSTKTGWPCSSVMRTVEP